MSTAAVHWMPSFFPYSGIDQVPVAAVFEVLLFVMWRWGFIQCFRFDNGRPFGDPTRQSLSPCALHLIALSCQVFFNPARSPTANAKVERTQGTTGRWADAANCADHRAFQQALDYAVRAQRELLPTRVCQGRTRAERFPALFQNLRRYHSTDFDIQRVYRFLAQGTWYRKISSQGVAQVFGQVCRIGRHYRSQQVSVKFDPVQVAWLFRDENGSTIAVCPAQNLNEQNIRLLSFSQ